MAPGLDSPSNVAMTLDKDPAYASLHAKLYSASHVAFRLADSPDFTPGPAGTPDNMAPNPGVRLADSPPPIVATNERPPQAAPGPQALDTPAPIVAAPAPAALTDAPPPAPVATDVRPGVPAPAPDATPAPAAPTPDAAAATPGNCTTFNYGDAGSSATDPKIMAWNPNPNSKSELTKNWFAENKRLASIAPEDGPYTVKFGDCLESIARRELKKEGKASDYTAVQAEKAKIIALNHDHYKSLDTKSTFIRDGWKLKLTDCAPAAPAPVAPAPEVPPPAPTPDVPPHVVPTNRPRGPHPKENCVPCGADVIIDDPKGKIFVQGQQAGDHDRVIVKDGKTTEVPIPTHGQRVTPDGPPPAPLVTRTDAPPPAPTPTRVEAPAPTTPAPIVETHAPIVAAPTPTPKIADVTPPKKDPDDDGLTPGPAGTPEVLTTPPAPAPGVKAPVVQAKAPPPAATGNFDGPQ